MSDMKVPKEIAMKAKEYHKAKEIADKAYEEVIEWLNENTDADGLDITDLFIADKPTGKKQNEDEFCNQKCAIWEDDAYYGIYYHKIDGMDGYMGYSYEC